MISVNRCHPAIEFPHLSAMFAPKAGMGYSAGGTSLPRAFGGPDLGIQSS
jgi:hypothetical protein